MARVEGAASDMEEARRPQSLLTGQVVWFLICAVVSMTSFFLLLSVVPLYASGGDESSVAAGLTTGAMMLTTVVAEFFTAGFLVRFGYRRGLAAGILLLGAPPLLLPLSDALPLILLVSLVRGVGLAITVVAGTSLAAALSPEGRRGEMLGVYGLGVSVPAIVALPAGVWLSEEIGFTAVFLLSAVFVPVALLACARFDAPHPESEPGSHNLLVALRWPGIASQTIIFTTTTIAAGVFVTFLPLAVDGDSSKIAALGLLAQSATAAVSRWAIGRAADRYGAGRLLVPTMAITALGAACLIAVHSSAAVILGMALFGVGYGGAQSVTLMLMFERAPSNEIDRVSSVWNLAFDGGLGIGAVVFGYFTAATGYPWGFAGITLVLLAAVGFSVVDSREARFGSRRLSETPA